MHPPNNGLSPIDELVPPMRFRRPIVGMSAVLLPHLTDGSVDWDGLAGQLEKAFESGLRPAVNMDTGFVQLLDDATRRRVLALTADVAQGRPFVAGAFVADAPGAPFDADRLARAAAAVSAAGGVPVVFPSWGLHTLSDHGWVDALAGLGEREGAFIAFELGEMFVPNGRILQLDAYRRLVQIPACLGAKHSSLSRPLEWARLRIRDEVRPDFLVLTGNDLAIDMVMWGSDYLLGLSTFAPDAFALRDRMWADGDADFFELNDLLQELGTFAFRHPVPAYRHDAAMFLFRRGWIAHDSVAAGSPTRPDSDRTVIADLVERIEGWLS